MVKIKDIELVKNKEKEIFVDINGKLFEVTWISEIGKMVILSAEEKKQKQKTVEEQEEEIDNMIRDTLPDDDYFEMHEPGYHIDTMLGRIIYD